MFLLGAPRQWQGSSSALRIVSKHCSHFFSFTVSSPKQVLTLSQGRRIHSLLVHVKGVGGELCVVPRDLLKPFRKEIPRALGVG